MHFILFNCEGKICNFSLYGFTMFAISAVKRLIASKIKVCLHNLCVCTVYIYFVYIKDTHIKYIFRKYLYVFTCLY